MKHLSTLALACLAVGCYDPSSSPRSVFRGIGEDPAAPSPTSPTRSPTAPTWPTSTRGTPSAVQPVATFDGTLGSVRDFSATQVEVADPGSSEVELNAVNASAGWWVMTRLTFDRPLTDPRWRLDQTYSLSSGVRGTDGVTAQALSCSGPRRGQFTFDSSPSRITMRMHEGTRPDTRMVTFVEYWSDSPDVVTGSFEFSLR